MKEIKYIGFYSLATADDRPRYSFPAATTKMDYICDALIEAGYSVRIVSPAWFVGGKSGAALQKSVSLGSGKTAVLAPSVISGSRLVSRLSKLLSLVWLTTWLLLNMRNKDVLLVYHSLLLFWPIRVAKLVRRFKLILEVEEMYQDAQPLSPFWAGMEDNFVDLADAYLFSTELLPERLIGTVALKPYGFVYGTYKIMPRLATPAQDGKTHLVYAGIIDDKKRGAFNALASAEHLDAGYVLHLIGFGHADATKKLQRECSRVNARGRCRVVFDGLKTGSEYIEYMQRLHIGLSTQSMDGDYLRSSYPSKILSYLSLGLSVVSPRIECVERSKVRDNVVFYDHDSGVAIAEAVRLARHTGVMGSDGVLATLHFNFVKNLRQIINSLNGSPSALRDKDFVDK